MHPFARTAAGLALGLAVAASAPAILPVIGQDVNPWGSQIVWPSNGNLTTYMNRFQDAGIQWARTELCWWSISEQSHKNFVFDNITVPGHGSPWNASDLVNGLDARGINLFAILAYGHPSYGSSGPTTAGNREAFADYCEAIVTAYKDSVKYWEIWNEPNLPFFWGATPDPAAYAQLVAVAAARIRSVDPDARIAAAATSGIDLTFINAAIAAGMLEHIDIVTVHPYRTSAPETINANIATLRNTINANTSRDIAIWTGEWGYNTCFSEVSELGQAKALSRMMINNLSQGIELSIWFSVHAFPEIDVCPTDAQWGLTDYSINPRPSMTAMQTMNERLGAPVAHVANSLNVRPSSSFTSQRIELFERASDRSFTAAIWEARWPVNEAADSYAGVTRNILMDVPSGTTVAAWNGITGASIAIASSWTGGTLTIPSVNIRDYPVLIDIELPEPARMEAWLILQD